jgi:hypothetical protein
VAGRDIAEKNLGSVSVWIARSKFEIEAARPNENECRHQNSDKVVVRDENHPIRQNATHEYLDDEDDQSTS